MNNQAYKILRWGVAITFIWIAVLIFRAPDLWLGFMPLWMADSLAFLPFNPMYLAAGFDLLVGIFLIANRYTMIVSTLAALHLLGLVFMLGFGDISARDFGLMAATIAIFVQARSNKQERKVRV